MKEPKVAIIISNFNGASIYYENLCILDTCLKTIEKTKYTNYKIYIADDSSTDESNEFVHNNFPQVEFIINKPNGGYAQNMNNTIKYALKHFKPDFLMLMNNDIIVKNKLWLLELVSTIKQYKNAGIVGCQLLYPNNIINNAGELNDSGNSIHNIRGRGEPYKGKYDNIEEVSLVTGAAFLIKKEIFTKVGYLDEVFFMGSDDTDIVLRSKDAGFKIIYNGKVKLIHLDSFTSNNLKDDSLRMKTSLYCERGAIYFILKWRKRYNLTHLIKLYLEHVIGIYFSITKVNSNTRNLKNLHMRYKLIKLQNNIEFPFIKRVILGIKYEIEGLYIYIKYHKIISSQKFIILKNTRKVL